MVDTTSPALALPALPAPAPDPTTSFSTLYHLPRQRREPTAARTCQTDAIHLHADTDTILTAQTGRPGTLSLRAGECLCKRHWNKTRTARPGDRRCTTCDERATRYGVAWPDPS